MRRAAKVDANQAEIVAALRKCGVCVQLLHAVGNGCPDLICGLASGENVFLEIKDGKKPPSARKLTPDQVDWHAAWKGRVVIVTSIEEALQACGVMR